MRFGFILLFLLFSSNSFGDCVYFAKSKRKVVRLDSHSILLKDGPGSDILIKTYSYIGSSPRVTVLKDDFCSYEGSVLYVDGQLIDANRVEKI